MNFLYKYGAIALIIGGIVWFSDSSNNKPVTSSVDLSRILDITIAHIETFETDYGETLRANGEPDAALFVFSEVIQDAYNGAAPPLHTSQVAVVPLVDASLMVVEDKNGDGTAQEDEGTVWTIEIDGQNSRVIASSWQGEVRDANFSGSGFLAGYLISSMLNRQSIHGDPKAVSNTKPRAPQYSTRSRAGSGSHRTGK